MVGEYSSAEGAVAALDRWSVALNELQGRIAHRFRRVEVRERVGRYLTGRLQRVERKNGWQLAEAIGEAGPQGVQRLLHGASRDADAVRDDLRAYVIEHLGDPASGVLIVDESGFPKKGGRSCGVAPQYCGAVGATANAQVGVFLAYASDRGTAFIDRTRYLPRAWADDRERRRAAGIPAGARFVTKVALARRLLTRAFAAGVVARWVIADALYGRSHAFRRWLEQRGRAYVLMVPKTTAVEYQGRRERAEQLGTRLPAAAWRPQTSAAGGQGGPGREWVCLALSRACADGMRRWLLIHRGADEPTDLAYHLAYAPAGISAAELVRVCAARWRIEEGFAQAKGAIGLDHDEVRGWVSWYRFVTRCLLAHAYLVVLRQQARTQEAQAPPGEGAVDLLPLTVPAIRRLVLAIAESAERRPFRLGWSRWRRRHRAIAAQSYARRARRRPPPRPDDPVAPPRRPQAPR